MHSISFVSFFRFSLSEKEARLFSDSFKMLSCIYAKSHSVISSPSYFTIVSSILCLSRLNLTMKASYSGCTTFYDSLCASIWCSREIIIYIVFWHARFKISVLSKSCCGIGPINISIQFFMSTIDLRTPCAMLLQKSVSICLFIIVVVPGKASPLTKVLAL